MLGSRGRGEEGKTYAFVVEHGVLDLQPARPEYLSFEHEQLERARSRTEYARKVGGADVRRYLGLFAQHQHTLKPVIQKMNEGELSMY